MVTRRPAGALAEALLALLVFAVGIIAALGAAASCARVLRFAESEFDAVLAAEALLDSIGASADPRAGSAVRAGVRFDWQVTARDGLAILELTPAGTGAAFRLVLGPAGSP